MQISRRALLATVPLMVAPLAWAGCLDASSPSGTAAAGDPKLTDAIYARIVKERNAIGAVPIRRRVNGSESEQAANRLRTGREEGSEILEDLLAAMKRRDRLSAVGWSLEADSVDAIALPATLMRPSTYSILIVAVPGRRPVEALLALV